MMVWTHPLQENGRKYLLPTRQATEAAPLPGPSPMPPQADPDIIKGLLEVHHAYTNVLKSLGVDACKDYEETRVETLLSKIVSGDRKCKLCDKSYFSTQKLKNHMQEKAFGEDSLPMWGVPQILWRFSIIKNTHEEACTSRRGGAAVHLWSLQQKFPYCWQTESAFREASGHQM